LLNKKISENAFTSTFPEILYFYKKKHQMMGFWKGFLTGIISTVTTGVIMNLIMKVITAIF